jgi:isoquinoline 1-oxidoreductase beta subunit
MKAVTQKIDRRGFLKAGAASAGGLLLGFYLPERTKLAAQGAATDAKLNAFVHIGSDDRVTIFLHKSEMGQGVVTSLSQLLGEELSATGKRSGPNSPASTWPTAHCKARSEA